MGAWDAGRYESTAEALEPVARLAVEALAPRAGERVLDLAAGTGNAALLAAARGAQVTAADQATRLLRVASERAQVAEVELATVEADATDLPFDDDAFDAAVSVFGVIFARPADAAATELARVVRPGGRIVVTDWRRSGAIYAAGQLVRDVLGDHGGAPADWHAAPTLERLFPGARVRLTQRSLPFASTSARSWLDEQLADHPMWMAAAQTLRERADGSYERLHRESLALLQERNEDPSAFRVTSPFTLALIELAA